MCKKSWAKILSLAYVTDYIIKFILVKFLWNFMYLLLHIIHIYVHTQGRGLSGNNLFILLSEGKAAYIIPSRHCFCTVYILATFGCLVGINFDLEYKKFVNLIWIYFTSKTCMLWSPQGDMDRINTKNMSQLTFLAMEKCGANVRVISTYSVAILYYVASY